MSAFVTLSNQADLIFLFLLLLILINITTPHNVSPTQTPALYQAVVAKYGIATMQGTIQLGPSIQWWKNLDPGKAFLERFVSRADSVDIVNGAQVCRNNTDDTGTFILKELLPNGKYLCTG